MTKDEMDWIKAHYRKDKTSKKGLGEKQFNQFANQVANHFQLCQN